MLEKLLTSLKIIEFDSQAKSKPKDILKRVLEKDL